MKKILVVGLTCIDIKTVVPHFPKEDADMGAISQTWAVGGNAANTSSVLAQHPNIKVSLFSGLSSQPAHAFVKLELDEGDVDISLCGERNCLLPTCTCILNLESSSRTILAARNDFPTLKFEEFRSNVNIEDYDWIHFEGRDFPDVGKMIQYTIEKRKTVEKPIISAEMEKVKRLEDLDHYVLPYVDVLFVSKDIAQAKGYKSALETVKGLSAIKDTNIKYLICPWGELGAAGGESNENNASHGNKGGHGNESNACHGNESCHGNENNGSHGKVFCHGNKQWTFYYCGAYSNGDIVDTLGAGDTFNAGLIHALVQKHCLKDALKYACRLAGMKCMQLGFKDLLKGKVFG